jgi:predicted SAM-dependent methyltransferase
MDLIKYNFGCGPKYLEGYVNVDGYEWPKVDILHDLSSTPYFWADSNSAKEIVSIEVLEHISFRKVPLVLREWYRILAKDGVLKIQVPDCGKMMVYYVNDQICDCVPHKDETNKFEAKKNCPMCQGFGMVNPLRWQFAFTGAQKHPFDIHQTFFTKEGLEDDLLRAGFRDLQFRPDINKLKVDAYKR